MFFDKLKILGQVIVLKLKISMFFKKVLVALNQKITNFNQKLFYSKKIFHIIAV